MPQEGITNTSNALSNTVIGILKTAYWSRPTFNNDNTVKHESEWEKVYLIPDTDTTIRFDVTPSSPIFEDDYGDGASSGIEKIIETIMNEVLNHIIENGEVAMKIRMDKLEQDYNALLTALSQAFLPAAGITPPGAVTILEYNAMVALVQSAIITGGTSTRQVSTTNPLKDLHEIEEGLPVQIK